MSYFLYRLNPPRPTFATDMTSAEAAIMADHVTYWTGLRDSGAAVAFGPVADPAGSWGVAIVEAQDERAAEVMRAGDPVVRTGLGTVDVFVMPAAVVRPLPRQFD